MILGITGGSGCGKTTLLEIFRQLGGTVLDCDEIYHELLQSDKEMLAQIRQRFPGTVSGNELDRKKLGNLVFADQAALLELNRITHSAVRREVLRRIGSAETPHIAIDAIGLFEGELAPLCDVTVAVTAPEEDRIARLTLRDNISTEYAKKRISAQRSCDEFSALCHHTLYNNSTQEDFRRKCLAFFEGLGIMKEK